MTLCFELQQSHEMDFALKPSDVGCLYQIMQCSAVQCRYATWQVQNESESRFVETFH